MDKTCIKIMGTRTKKSRNFYIYEMIIHKAKGVAEVEKSLFLWFNFVVFRKVYE